MDLAEKAALRFRWASSAAEWHQALALRAQAFRQGADDGDEQDGFCRHGLVLGRAGPLATFRLRRLADGAAVRASYCGRRYDLSRLALRPMPMAELGRFALAPAARHPDVIRLAWAAVAAQLAAWQARFLFGATSFAGTEPAAQAAQLAQLGPAHLAPPDWAPLPRPGVETMALSDLPAPGGGGRGPAALPPLLRAYLGLGAKVSHHLVIDRDLGTFHLFTGLDLAAPPAGRLQALGRLAVDLGGQSH